MSKLRLKNHPTLRDLQDYVEAAVKERGFSDNLTQRFMLLMEECGELAKAARKQASISFAADTKDKEIADEAADVLIILLGICNMLSIDLEQAFRDKEEHNKQRVWQ